MSKKPIYILGTGTSHDGSACLLRDGEIAVAIEKERITRVKHDGFNDSDAIQYCLKAEGITLDDVSLVVQNDNFGDFKYGSENFFGPRLLKEGANYKIHTISHHLAHAYSAIGTCPFDEFNIIVMDGCGSPSDQCIDLTGGIIPDVNEIKIAPHLYCEKDSFYHFKNGKCATLYKDFSPWSYIHKYPMYPNTTLHSIGGLYEAVSKYCVGGMADPGKLMGLAPYGKEGAFQESIFDLKDGRVYVNYDWIGRYQKPSKNYQEFKESFGYYADIAYGVQKEIERAILYVISHRLSLNPCDTLCYAGGTALNAVANARILKETGIKNLYIEPAAGDNGLALGCAFYGWLEILQQKRVKHSGSTCFGITYSEEATQNVLNNFTVSIEPEILREGIHTFFEKLNAVTENNSDRNGTIQFNIEDVGVYQIIAGQDGTITSIKGIHAEPSCTIEINGNDFRQLVLNPGAFEEYISNRKLKVSNIADLNILLDNYRLKRFADHLPKLPGRGRVNHKRSEDIYAETAKLLADGKIIGWFQEGSEFGPRALGHRSILADPRKPDVRNFINSRVKFREDFRPFAPSVIREDVSLYFDADHDSPYMILVDQVREEWADKISSVVHVNGSCRIQTVTPLWNLRYYKLLEAFKSISGISVLLNTSFNRKGMPIVETPENALKFFFECELDYLVIGDFIIGKEDVCDHADNALADTAITAW